MVHMVATNETPAPVTAALLSRLEFKGVRAFSPDFSRHEVAAFLRALQAGMELRLARAERDAAFAKYQATPMPRDKSAAYGAWSVAVLRYDAAETAFKAAFEEDVLNYEPPAKEVGKEVRAVEWWMAEVGRLRAALEDVGYELFAASMLPTRSTQEPHLRRAYELIEGELGMEYLTQKMARAALGESHHTQGRGDPQELFTFSDTFVNGDSEAGDGT